MAFTKALAALLALNRMAFGFGYLVRPRQAEGTWIGSAARKPGTQVMIRSQGVRDLALGAGALQALARGDVTEQRAWLAGHTVSDLVDLVATWSARSRLPKRRARAAIGIAAASTVVG